MNVTDLNWLAMGESKTDEYENIVKECFRCAANGEYSATIKHPKYVFTLHKLLSIGISFKLNGETILLSWTRDDVLAYRQTSQHEGSIKLDILKTPNKTGVEKINLVVDK